MSAGNLYVNDSEHNTDEFMKAFVVAYFAALFAFLIIDGLWLGVIAKTFYANQLGDLMRKNLLVMPAVLFYLLYTAGLVVLAVRPSEPEVELSRVALYGALVGLLAYGTYDLTNYATLKDWPFMLSLVDIIWGTLLSASVATISSFCLRQFG